MHAVSDPRNPQPPEAGTVPQYEHYSLRTEHFRYVRYNDGVEELYDHRVDPYEWTNIVDDPAHRETLFQFRIRLGGFIPALEPENWAGYPIANEAKDVDTKGFMGWINVALGDYIWSYSLSSWMYCPESNVTASGAWVYVQS